MSTVDILGVIPARGGSKGLPNKNIRLFNGKPLIAWSIQEAAGSRRLTRTVVSTDSEEIAGVARQWGGDVPFLRPPHLSGDDVPLWPVMVHAGEWYEEVSGRPPGIIACLQPTSPLRTCKHIDDAIDLFLASDADALMSLTEVEHTPYKMRVIEGGYIRPFVSRDQLVGQRQEAPLVYRLNGIINLIRYEVLKKEKAMWSERTIPVFHSQEEGINIDTEPDFLLAESLQERSMSHEPSR